VSGAIRSQPFIEETGAIGKLQAAYGVIEYGGIAAIESCTHLTSAS